LPDQPSALPNEEYADTVLLVPAKEWPADAGALSTKLAQIHLIHIFSHLLQRRKANASVSLEQTLRSVVDKFF
jgi:DNA-binding MurR/RpiR family transcriptional regulator